MAKFEKEYDVVIAGAGASGCVLASRLSEKPGRKVLLLDAGPYFRTLDSYPPELSMMRSLGAMVPGNPQNWSFVATLVDDRVFPMPRGKVVGGSSAINGTVVLRPPRADFDEWAALGNNEWTWDSMLPYYIKSEHDLDYPDAAYHGSSGLMPVRRAPADELHPLSAAFIQACLDHGFIAEPDKNASGAPGVGPIPHNVVDGIRMNTAITYLAAAIDRPNLTVQGGAYVRRVLFVRNRAIGLEVECDGEVVQIHGGEIVISAGAIKSPQLLMLSGIGPAGSLQRHGIQALQDAPGVGQHLIDHPLIALDYRISDMDLGASAPLSVSPNEVLLNYTAEGSEFTGDLQIGCYAEPINRSLLGAGPGAKRFRLPPYLAHPFTTLNSLRRLPAKYVLNQALAGRNLTMPSNLEKQTSRGQITLRSNDPLASPDISMNYLATDDDRRRMRENVRTSAELLQTPTFQKLGARQQSLSRDDLTSDAALDSWIRANLATAFHAGCTARMGPETDSTAVVDQHLRVRGVEGLRVIDISVMPSMVRRGPYATAIMIAERASDFFE